MCKDTDPSAISAMTFSIISVTIVVLLPASILLTNVSAEDLTNTHGSPDLPGHVHFSAVMNDFEDMIVEWCDGTDLALPAYTYTLNWTVQGYTAQHDECRNYGPGKCSCFLNNEQTIFFETYLFTLKAMNGHGTRYMRWNMATDQTVARAGPVRNAVVSPSSPNEMQIDWDRPRGLRAYYSIFPKSESYVVNISNQWGDFNQTFYVDESMLVVDNLEPHTTYYTSIQAVIPGSQYPGNVTSVETKTAEAAPSSGPSVVAHREVACDDGAPNCRNVILYWQDIPPRHENGPVHGAEVSHQDTEDSIRLQWKYSYEWGELTQLRPYDFTVRAENIAGWSPHTYYRVPDLNTSIPVVAGVFLEYWEGNDTLQLHWQPPVGHIDKLILLWCRPDEQHCQSSPSLLELPSNTSEVSLETTESPRVFGLMAVINGATSSLGPHWICNYRANGEPSVPIVSATDPGQSEVTLTFSLPPCHQLQPKTAPGRVVSYTVQYGIQSCTNEGLSLHLPGATTQHRLRELTPGQTYRVCVTAVGRIANTSADEVTFSTLKSDTMYVIIIAITSVLAVVLIVAALTYISVYHIKPYFDKLDVRVEVLHSSNMVMPDPQLDHAYQDPDFWGGIGPYVKISLQPGDEKETLSFSDGQKNSDTEPDTPDSGNFSMGEPRLYWDINSSDEQDIDEDVGNGDQAQISNNDKNSSSAYGDPDSVDEGIALESH